MQTCLLVALEEEAAIEVHPELREAMAQNTELRYLCCSLNRANVPAALCTDHWRDWCGSDS